METVELYDQNQQPELPPGQESIWDDKTHLDVLKHFVEDDVIPEPMKKRQWWIFGKALQYTFLKEEDLPMMDIMLELSKIGEYMSKPPHMLTFNQVNEIDKMANYGYMAAKRAIGFKGEMMNERTLSVTNISQNIGMPGQMMPKRKKFLGLI